MATRRRIDMSDYAAIAALANGYMNRHVWSKDAIQSCNFEMYEKPNGPHCMGRAVNLAANDLGVPFGPVHEFLANKIRAEYPRFTLAGDDVDVIAEWNNHPEVTRADVDALLADA
jgi:hypothetical protein